MRTRGRMVPTRGRGGGHDWIGVDALLWVDHVEIRLLLSRIKAVWGAMRQVRGVVAIVMIHEVQREELERPVRRIYTRKKTVAVEEKKKKKKRGGRRRGRGGEMDTGSSRKGEEMRSDSFLEQQHAQLYVLSQIRIIIFIFISHSHSRDDPMSTDTPLPSMR
jgi:hypothetical protein